MYFRQVEAGPYYPKIAYSPEDWPQFTAEMACTSPVTTNTVPETSIEQTLTSESTSNLSQTSTSKSSTRKNSIRMVSKLEDALLRHSTDSVLRQKLFEYLDDANMRKLRLVSRVLHDLVDHNPDRIFGGLYLQAPLNHNDHMESLEVVAPFCQNMTITARERNSTRGLRSFSSTFTRGRSVFRSSIRESKRDGSRPPLRTINSDTRIIETPTDQALEKRMSQDAIYNQWLRIFSKARNLKILTMRVDDRTATWPGRTEIEDALVTLRTAIEESATNLTQLREIRLAPVHAMGIVHLRWNNLSRFTPTATKLLHYTPSVPLLSTPSSFWQNLRTLHLHVRNPKANTNANTLTSAQNKMFLQLLYDYLRGFTDTLRIFRFVWLDADGPSPLELNQEPGLEHRTQLMWAKLQELWLGNTTYTHRTIRLLSEIAPVCTSMKTLRRGGLNNNNSDTLTVPKTRGHRYTKSAAAAAVFNSIDPSKPSAWVDVLLGKHDSNPVMKLLQIPQPPTNFNSIYSNGSADSLEAINPPFLTPDRSPELSPDRSPIARSPVSNLSNGNLSINTKQQGKFIEDLSDCNIWGSPTIATSVFQHTQQGLSARNTRTEGTTVSRSSRVVPFMLDLREASKRLLSMTSSNTGSVVSFPDSKNNSNQALVVTSL